MRRLVSGMLSFMMLISSFTGLCMSVRAEGEVVFKHQNIVGSQTPYSGTDLDEQIVTSIPNVIQGMRINQPVFRVENLTAQKKYTVVQELKDRTVLSKETVTAASDGTIEFNHLRNCEMIEVFDGSDVVASLGTEQIYVNGVSITSAPMSYQIYQRNAQDEADIVIKGTVLDVAEVSVDIDGNSEDVVIENGEFTYTKSLGTGLYNITVSSENGEVARYEQVGVGDIWVAAGQSNMTDMGAITDSFDPETGDPINENMHIIYAEDTTWHIMSHPAGEGRFFKSGVRTSPVTSFARELAKSENVPIGIVQSSVGGTNIYQWVSGVRDSDPNSGYLIKALKSCFDKMPSHDIKGILWYQGCNDAINENYAYNYKNLQQKVFDNMREFFGDDVPVITTQINDANQDSTSKLGYYDAWSYVKDIQRQNEELYDNVYVVGTGELELGDTIHNNAASNVKLGVKWANAAKNIVYGDTSVNFRTPTIDTAVVTGKNEITLNFKNTQTLATASGTKRIGITNVSGGGYKIELGDLAKEFRVRTNGDKNITASNGTTGTNLTISNAEIKDNTKVVITTKEELSGRVAVDCMYGKRFTPTLIDSKTGESVLAFFNVIADDPNGLTGTDDEDEASNIFGSEYNEIKAFTTSSLAETTIGNSGYKVSTSSSNYNNVVVRDKASAKTGYYPYGGGLPENGYYLFFGSGGNGNVSAVLTLQQPVKAGKYIKITYAKPYATNNGNTNRNQDNSAEDKITIGSETIDLKGGCEFDKWYTTIVKADSEVSKLNITLGRWGAMAISDIKVLDSADMMEFSSETDKKYITSKNQTVQYSATVYKSITMLMNDSEVISRGTVDTSANITYSVNGYEGVSIDNSGLLTVTPDAKEGTVIITAVMDNIEKTLELELCAVSDADTVKIIGDELVKKGGKLALKAIPMADGTIIPERDADWTIEGDSHGCTIDDGILTVPSDAISGNITVKATLKVQDKQTSENISDSFTVTVKGDEVSPYTIEGVFLKNCIADVISAGGVDGLAIDTDTVSEGYGAVVKAMDENGMVIAKTDMPLDALTEGVTEVKTPLTFQNAQKVRAYIVNSKGEIVSDEIYVTNKTSYKNVPLVSDWITGEKSGLGMGKGIMAPTGVPYGVNPDTVDVYDLNVSYTYDAEYPEPSADNALWYKTGAYLAGNSSNNNSIYARDGVDWEQKALPIGNGYMGGMLFGLPDKDQIQINEETFWAAGYRGVQTSVAANNVNKNMSEGINGYMSVGNIFVDFNMPKGSKVNNYYRDLNLDEAVAHVSYEYDGVKYNREYFASYPKEVLVFRYTANDAALNFDVNPVSMHPGEVSVNNGEITIIGNLKDSEPYSSGGNAAWNQKSDLEYCTKIKVIADDGVVTDGYNNVKVANASGVTILVAASTDYDKDQFELNADGSVNMSKTPYKSSRGVLAAVDKTTARINGAAAMTYEELKAEHIKDYKSQFDKVKFTLTDDDEICKTPTDELQKSYDRVIGTQTVNGKTNVSYTESTYKDLDKHLEELHYNYARYMMISSSRSTTMPATLQGKWCQSTAEIWGSCYCININMEMNYWFAGGANLLDSGKSLIDWFNSQIPAGRITARNMYKVTPKSYSYSDGKITFSDSSADEDDVFIMHTKQAIMGTTDLTGSTSIQSAGNTAWLMYNLWDLYCTSGDKELLANELYPIMRKAANFYTQYLYTNERKSTTDKAKYPDGYYYTTWAGRSPEQGPTEEGIKYDLQLVAGMYDYTIAAAKVLGVDSDKVEAWEEIRNHLELPIEIGADGEIKEWSEEVSYNTDADGKALGDPVHRHISHLVGLYPGTLINRDTPELLEGAKIVLQNRGDDSTGWSCSNKFLLWARTLEGNKALELFRYQLAKKTYSNLFDTHAPFQIDGNFGSAAGVMELLMQSQTGDIYILPALPDVWDKGEISGIKAKNGAEVSIKWDNNMAEEIKIIPAADGDITIGYDMDNIVSLNGAGISFVEGKYTIENAKKGQIYTFSDKAAEINRKIIVLNANSVNAQGKEGDTLIVAGYDANGIMTKIEIINGFSSELTDYDNCNKIKAFLWDSLDGMKPYDCMEFEISK